MKNLFLLPLFLLMACSPKQDPSVNPQPKVDPDKDMEKVELNSTITTIQPMTGLVMWTTHDKLEKYQNSISLEYSYCLPCRVVTGKVGDQIQYDWTYFEKILNDISSRGHQAVVRFRYEYPGSKEVDGTRGSTAVPQYIKDLPDYEETFYDSEEEPACYYADWSNAELQWFTKQFYTDFAAKYNNDVRIAFVEVGFGHWSEYHIYGTPLKLGTNFPSKEYQAEFLTHVDQVLELPWAISIDAADGSYTPIVKTSELMALSFGLFDDSFMHKDHGDYNEECWGKIGQDTRWRKGVCGGEISYYTSKDQKNFLNPAGLYGHTWEEQAAKFHITFMIANDAPGSTYGTVARFLEAALASGYRYQVVKCATSDTITALTVTNAGVAPIYYDAYFAIGTQKSKVSLRTVCPGDTVRMTFPGRLTNTKDIHIECDHLLPGKSIGFEANTTK